MSQQAQKTSTALYSIRSTDGNQWEKILFCLVREVSIGRSEEKMSQEDVPLTSSQFSIFSDEENNASQACEERLVEEFVQEEEEATQHHEEVEDQENLGEGTIEEGKVGRDGKPGKVFYHSLNQFAFHQKTTKRGADGQKWLSCKTTSCPAKLVIAADDRTVLKVYGGAHTGHQSNLIEREIEKRL